MKARKWIITLFVLVLTGAFSGSGLSAPPKEKCNSGNGNGQETTIENDCDPGNSGGNNNGGG